MIELAQGSLCFLPQGVGLHPQLPHLLAQVNTQEVANYFGLGPNVVDLIWRLLLAIAILIVGWIVAALLASGIRSLLKRTNIDNRIAHLTAGERADTFSIENVIATVVFWIVMILAIVGALNALQLNTVSQPLNNFLNQIFAYLPRIGGAIFMVAVAWVVATLSRIVAIRLARSLGLDERLQASDTQVTRPPAGPEDPYQLTPEAVSRPPQSQFLLSETLGNILYWFVFLFFLPLILGILNLEGPLQPVQNLLNEFLLALPNIVKAILIGIIGWFIARIVRDIVTNLLIAVGTDRIGSRVGLTRTGGQSLSSILGTLVFVLILIPTVIAALDALQIRSISVPAALMLNQFLTAIPQIFTAALILVLGYIIGQFVKDLVTNLLTGLGFNNVLNWLGLPSPAAAPPIPPPPALDQPVEGSPMLIQPDVSRGAARTPSEIVGIIVLIGIMLFAAVAATNVLGIPALTAIVSGLLVILGQILVGLVIFAIGLYLANLAYSIIAGSDGAQSRILGQAARIAIIVLVAAMALQQIGIAPSIINLAFGLLLGAIAVAIALAFGLGGRDVAADQLRDWLASFKRRD
ncbi:mechanosensitive ion channel [Leptodesmis sichuanensis]|uniref:mechanosensitive ion channel n=1 Tax=Leptodesmis sichuanensis TaxID=2906798 RepID=UPI001F259A81|nr:mechanosensitive ion channel [Leptodesmis sichuanensis]UIE37068.1 mechanosensitive ion channel [Leptodesmis sichuanensis A121]